jgi:hypothetical protein
MDQIQLKQKIGEYFVKLPKEAQDVFSSLVWMETLKEIATKYNLNPEEIEILGTETTLVLLGIIHLGEYQENLERELIVEKETIEKIIMEIDDRILKTIKEQLSETFESNLASLEKENGILPVTGDGNSENSKNILSDSSFDKIPLPPYSKIRVDRPEPIKPLQLKVEIPVTKAPEAPKNIMEEKLNNVTANDNKVSDYSISKKTFTPSSGDPYREEI